MIEDTADDALGVLDRMTQILHALGQDDRGMGLSELARRSGLPKSTVSRLVGTLVAHRYLERDGRLIHLGLRVFELGQLAREPRELRAVALPVMLQLRDRTGENVHLAIRDGRDMVCVAALRGRSGAPSRVRVGARLPAHASALGKVGLAYAAVLESEDAAASELTVWTPQTVTDEATLQEQLYDIRNGALAVEDRELSPDVSGLASALLAPDGRLVGALSVTGRADAFDAEAIAPQLRAAARTLMRRLAVTV